MKKAKNLFAEVYEYENLLAGYVHAVQTLKNTLKESSLHYGCGNAEEVVINVQNHLIHKTYETGNLLHDAIVEYALLKALSANKARGQSTVTDEGLLWLIGVFGLNSLNIAYFDML